MTIELLLARGAAQALEPGLEAQALLEVEDHVAGVIGPEVAVDADDVRVVELGERLGFLDEAVEAPAVIAGTVLGARAGLDAAAGGKIGGKVLLDGDAAVERNLVGKIGDAESASTKHALDAEVADKLRTAL